MKITNVILISILLHSCFTTKERNSNLLKPEEQKVVTMESKQHKSFIDLDTDAEPEESSGGTGEKVYFPFSLHRQILIDSINRFAYTKIIPWFIRDNFCNVNSFRRKLPEYSPSGCIRIIYMDEDMNADLIARVNDSCSIKLLISQLDCEYNGLCDSLQRFFTKTTTKELLSNRLNVIRSQK